MLRDHGLRNTGPVGQGVHGLLSVAGEVLEDGAPGRVGESFEYVIFDNLHGKTITERLWFVKCNFLACEVCVSGMFRGKYRADAGIRPNQT